MQNLIPDYDEKYGHVFSPFHYILPRDLGLDTKGSSSIKLCTCSFILKVAEVLEFFLEF